MTQRLSLQALLAQLDALSATHKPSAQQLRLQRIQHFRRLACLKPGFSKPPKGKSMKRLDG